VAGSTGRPSGLGSLANARAIGRYHRNTPRPARPPTHREHRRFWLGPGPSTRPGLRRRHRPDRRVAGDGWASPRSWHPIRVRRGATRSGAHRLRPARPCAVKRVFPSPVTRHRGPPSRHPRWATTRVILG
jgi:hypothetical protein